jgi:hypothetical protein
MNWEDKFNELKEQLDPWEFIKTLTPRSGRLSCCPGGERKRSA